MNKTISQKTIEVYECLKNRVAYLNLQWALYQNLFMQDDVSIKILENYGGIFGLLQRLMLNNFALSFVNLISKEKIKGHSQLCLLGLVGNINKSHPHVFKELLQIYDELKIIGKFLSLH